MSEVTPDQVVYWQWGFVQLNATIVFTWVVMAILVIGSWLITRKLSSGPDISRWQNLLEIIVDTARDQIRGIARHNPDPYLPFIGTLFLFIAMSNMLAVVPGFKAPTGSLSATAALAICVFVAVPAYGILSSGPVGYVKRYLQPSPIMLPFNLIGELTRTLALAVRLFGNAMSGAKIGAILVSIIPLFVTIPLNLLGMLTGLIQAYIFAILSMVYIASGTERQNKAADTDVEPDGSEAN